MQPQCPGTGLEGYVEHDGFSLTSADHLSASLEEACSSHTQFMTTRSMGDATTPQSGHTMMATHPPYNHVVAHPDEPYPHQMPPLPSTHLIKLFDLSQGLPLSAEYTPIQALAYIRSLPRYHELTLADFESITNELKTKTRCYG